MESTITKVVDILMQQDESILNDKDHLEILSITKGIQAFTKISELALRHGKTKKLSVAKREEMGFELSKILFYAACISHVNHVDSSVFDIEDLTTFSQTLPEDIQEDKVLCCMHGIGMFMNIAHENILLNGYDEDELEEEDIIPKLHLIPGTAATDDNSQDNDDDGDEDPIEHFIAELYACVLILCDLLDLDVESVMSNVTHTTQP